MAVIVVGDGVGRFAGGANPSSETMAVELELESNENFLFF